MRRRSKEEEAATKGNPFCWRVKGNENAVEVIRERMKRTILLNSEWKEKKIMKFVKGQFKRTKRALTTEDKNTS